LKAKRTTFWIILAAFVGLAIWWSTYFPYDPGRLYRSVPGEAVFVSEHRKLGARWGSVARNPLTRSVLAGIGLQAAEIDAIARDPNAAALVDKLASKHVVVAYVPALGGTGESAWVFASWLGRYGQFVRWGSAAGLFQGVMLTDTRLGDGRKAWLLDPGRPDSDEVVSMTVVDDMLVGCYSEDPFAVRHVVRRVESDAALVPDLAEALERGMGEACLDRGWVGSFDETTVPEPMNLQYGLNTVSETTSEGWVRGEMPRYVREGLANVPVAKTGPEDMDQVEELLDGVPGAFVMLPVGYVDEIFKRGGPAALRIVWKELYPRARPDTHVFMCLLGGDHSGRILGLKVPAIVAGVRVTDEDQAMEAATESLDAINAARGWSLIPRKETVGAHPVVVVDGTRGGLYGSAGEKEKPAFTVSSGWFVLSSNMGTLEKLLRGMDAAGVMGVNGAEWREGIGSGEGPAYAWIDMESSGVALRNAIAVYTLVLLAQNAPDRAELREGLERAKTWIDAAGSIETCMLWLDSEETEFELRFKLGAVGKAPVASRKALEMSRDME